jgi:hypothetical protein
MTTFPLSSGRYLNIERRKATRKIVFGPSHLIATTDMVKLKFFPLHVITNKVYHLIWAILSSVTTPNIKIVRPMMSRQDGYKNRIIMSDVDIDLDSVEPDSPPSPPLRSRNDRTDEDNNREDDRRTDDPPNTPYYDYACSCCFGTELTL